MSAVERPCGCLMRSSCRCVKSSIDEQGAFWRECPYCDLVWTGRRDDVNFDLFQHVRSDEHKAGYEARRQELAVIDAVRELELEGLLF